MPDDRDLVGDEVVQLRRGQCAARSPGSSMRDPRAPARRRRRPASVHALAVDLDHERWRRERSRQRAPSRSRCCSNASGRHLPEARRGVDRVDLTVDPAADVDRHVRLPSGRGQSTASVGSENAGHFCEPSGKSARRQRPRDLPDRRARSSRRSAPARRGRSRRAWPRCPPSIICTSARVDAREAQRGSPPARTGGSTPCAGSRSPT